MALEDEQKAGTFEEELTLNSYVGLPSFKGTSILESSTTARTSA